MIPKIKVKSGRGNNDEQKSNDIDEESLDFEFSLQTFYIIRNSFKIRGLTQSLF